MKNEIELLVKMEASIVRSGDTLIVRVPMDTTEFDFDRAVKHIGAALPGVGVLVVRADQLMVYRPDEVVGE